MSHTRTAERTLIGHTARKQLKRRIHESALYDIQGPLLIAVETAAPSSGKLYVASGASEDFEQARERIMRLTKTSRVNTNPSEKALGNICKLKEGDLCNTDSLLQAPADGWVIIISKLGKLTFVRPPAGFIVYLPESCANTLHAPEGADTAQSVIHHLRASVEHGGQTQMCRSKTSHDAVSETVPQYIGVHYFFGRLCPWKGGTTSAAESWRKVQAKRAKSEEDAFSALLPLSFYCMRRASASIGVEQTGRVLTCQLVTSGFAAQDHVDNDLAPYTLCSICDDGVVRGGFQFGGWYVPLASGHTFAFDGRVRHSMCGDSCEPNGVRWSSASFLSRNMAKAHGASCTCRGCVPQV